MITVIIGDTVNRHSHKCTKQNSFNRNFTRQTQLTYGTSEVLTANTMAANNGCHHIFELRYFTKESYLQI